MYFNFGNNLCNNTKVFDYFITIITKIIIDYNICEFLFYKLGFFFSFSKFDNKNTLNKFGGVL